MAEKTALRRRDAARTNSRAQPGIACGRKTGGNHAEERRVSGGPGIARAPCQVTVCDMGHFMGNHPLQHFRALHLQDQAGMDKDRTGIDHECVQAVILDHHNAHLTRGQARSRDDGPGQFAQGALHLRISQDRDRCRRQR